MKGILKLLALLIAIFSTSFALNLYFGWITADTVRASMEALRESPDAVLWIVLIVIAVLAIDSLLAVPTITTIVLAGYFLGPLVGGAAAALGVMLAGCICFFGSRFGGDRIFRAIVSPEEGARLQAWFESSGALALLLSRSLPMLPEVLSCVAGMSGMRALRYLTLFALGNIPFVFLAAWAGSQSSLEKPWPALIVGMGLPAIAWLVYYARERGWLSRGSREIQQGVRNGSAV